MAHEVAEDTQVNTRLNKKLKKQGDSVFAKLGITPSQAIRSFYEFAASNRNNPGKVAEVINLQEGESNKEESEREQRCSVLKQSRNEIERMKRKLGVEGAEWGTLFGGASDKEVLEQAMLERASEKGLLQ